MYNNLSIKTPYFDIHGCKIFLGNKVKGPDGKYYMVDWLKQDDYIGVVLQSIYTGKIIKNPFELWNNKVTIVEKTFF